MNASDLWRDGWRPCSNRYRMLRYRGQISNTIEVSVSVYRDIKAIERADDLKAAQAKGFFRGPERAAWFMGRHKPPTATGGSAPGGERRKEVSDGSC